MSLGSYKSHAAITTLSLLLFATLSACVPLKQYRWNNTPCTASDLNAICSTHSLQELKPAEPSKAGYRLGFVELDDQGQFFDRKQMDAVMAAVSAETARPGQDVLIIVFVHGWKHNAAPGDENIEVFRDALARLAQTELATSRALELPPRRVFGVYVGWRGASVSWPVVKQLTFWDRKNTAHEVGHGDVTELLNRLELIQRIKNGQEGEPKRSRMVTIGHSFGGAVVFSALNQQLVSRFVRTTGGPEVSADAEGFGNLVVLINPAFQAQLYSSLRSMSSERKTYFAGQLPVLAILTSEADNATRVAFPLGRYFSTLWEKERTVRQFNPVLKADEDFSQRQANLRTVGHYEPYRTHTLRAVGSRDVARGVLLSESETVGSMLAASGGWDEDKPENAIHFPGSVLTRGNNTAGRNPYLVIHVDKELLQGHNDLSDPRIEAFITQLILVASQSPNAETRAKERSMGILKQRGGVP